MDYTNLKERMEKSIGAFKEKLSEIRAGRANPAILNKVKIDYNQHQCDHRDKTCVCHEIRKGKSK